MSVGLKQFQEKRKLLAVSRAAGAGAIVGAAPKYGQLAHNADGLIFAVFLPAKQEPEQKHQKADNANQAGHAQKPGPDGGKESAD